MPKLSRPRYGSLQFYPRKRAAKIVPSVNWDPVKGQGILGIIAYKAAMATAVVKDSTDKSMTLNKKIFVPITILEVPNMKIFSVRFYRDGRVLKEVIVSQDTELKKLVKLPKKAKTFDSEVPEGFEDVRLLVYSLVKQTGIKKTPDMAEIAIGGENKLETIKGLIGKELTLADFLKYDLLDTRGLTTGKGLVGPVKRFGISLKSHKSEKGVRRPGSLAPWHPSRVTFHAPMAGQLGMFTRVQYNNSVLTSGNVKEKDINPKKGFKNYGNIKSSYIMVKGSVQGPPKRVILLTPSFRPTKSQAKKKYEFLEMIL